MDLDEPHHRLRALQHKERRQISVQVRHEADEQPAGAVGAALEPLQQVRVFREPPQRVAPLHPTRESAEHTQGPDRLGHHVSRVERASVSELSFDEVERIMW